MRDPEVLQQLHEKLQNAVTEILSEVSKDIELGDILEDLSKDYPLWSLLRHVKLEDLVKMYAIANRL